eukprot:2824980-Prymnesium_polylepis.1
MRARLEVGGEEVRWRERAALKAKRAGAAEMGKAEEATRRAACEQKGKGGGSSVGGEAGQSM